MSESGERFDYYIGGHLDGVSLPLNEHAEPVMTESSSGHVYTRQPLFDNDRQRVWIQEGNPSKILAELPQLTQAPKPGMKELDLGDLASFVVSAQRLGFSKATKVRGLLSWLGYAREIRVHRKDDPNVPVPDEG